MELGEPDASGRRKPVEKKGSEFTLDAQTVIIAIGNSPNPLIKNTTPGLETQRWGRHYRRRGRTGATSIENVYGRRRCRDRRGQRSSSPWARGRKRPQRSTKSFPRRKRMDGIHETIMNTMICRDIPGILSIAEEIKSLADARGFVLAAIDGRAASGKSTLAHMLEKHLVCNVFHMDDFFLPQEMKTQERLNVPGENVHWERFRADILEPLKEREPFSYRPYSCKTQSLGEPVQVTPSAINLVEGSYALHPELSKWYDYKIFVDIPYTRQIERILSRNGADMLLRFQKRMDSHGRDVFSGFFRSRPMRQDS